jgi:hypothetical protein
MSSAVVRAGRIARRAADRLSGAWRTAGSPRQQPPDAMRRRSGGEPRIVRRRPRHAASGVACKFPAGSVGQKGSGSVTHYRQKRTPSALAAGPRHFPRTCCCHRRTKRGIAAHRRCGEPHRPGAPPDRHARRGRTRCGWGAARRRALRMVSQAPYGRVRRIRAPCGGRRLQRESARTAPIGERSHRGLA